MTGHFVYQRIHTLAGKPLHLAAHLDLAARSYLHIYGGERPEFDEKAIAARIAETLRANRSPARGSATVMLLFAPGDDGRCEISVQFERVLLDAGYAVSSLRPKAVTYEYSIPFGGFPTGFQLSAQALFDSLALRHHSATRSVRREGDRLLSCGDAPLFGIRGKTLFTAPLIEGAVDSVERRRVIAAATRNYESKITNYDKPERQPLRLDFLEEAIPHSGLTDFDELFFADAAGLTSLSECDGAKFMSLTVHRILEALKK